MGDKREFADGEVVPGTRYRVVGLIGAGGMGSVYEVEHEELGKRFVLKALLLGLTNRDDLVQRLRNEWRALGRLEHANIVSVTDAGVTDTGLPFYVMERLQGETLAQRLRRDRCVPFEEALRVAVDVLEGLSAAHRIGIVHRDVKPPNIFLVKDRPAKLLDFGIAKMLDPKASQITGRGVAIGTPRYMAPEQATGGTVDARTDLYAVGLILFEMIAGVGPFDGVKDPNEVLLAHIAHEAPLLSSRVGATPPELDRIVASLLAKKAEKRPPSADHVAAGLRAVAQHVSAVRPPGEASRDDATIPGGPFDTLEGAATVPSTGSPERPTTRVQSEAATRTHAPAIPVVGVATGASDARAVDTHVASSAPAFSVSKTLPLAEDLGDAPPTRTAVPPTHGETPPPVTGASREGRTERVSGRSVWLGLGAVACLAAAAVWGLRSQRAVVSLADGAERPAPAVAPVSQQVRAAVVPVASGLGAPGGPPRAPVPPQATLAAAPKVSVSAQPAQGPEMKPFPASSPPPASPAPLHAPVPKAPLPAPRIRAHAEPRPTGPVLPASGL